MQPAKKLIAFILLIMPLVMMAQGNSCTTPHTLSVDGVYRNYAVSSSTGSCVTCSMSGYSGNNGHLTYFKFTTDHSADCVLLDLGTSSSATLEIALYTDCIAGAPVPSGGVYYHTMCMTDGVGLWAPDLFNNLAANTTYILRVRTENGFTGNLTVSAKYYTPPNDNCIGATYLGATAVQDNNSCHTPGPGVLPVQLCATTLENTAWYTYYTLNSGNSTITIDNINCDNGNGNNVNGFQIGFFKGTCNSLTPISCSSGSGGTVTATASGLTAMTRIYVAIDGYSGSNCSYSVKASNSVPLPVHLKSFNAGEYGEQNLLKWVTVSEDNNAGFEIERSFDGRSFNTIGRVDPLITQLEEKAYSYIDEYPLQNSWYRLKQIDISGQFYYSQIVEVRRQNLTDVRIINSGSVYDELQINFQFPGAEKLSMQIVDVSGRTLLSSFIAVKKGNTIVNKKASALSNGRYVIVLRRESGELISRSFIKAGIH
jgi:hypothetical protein